MLYYIYHWYNGTKAKPHKDAFEYHFTTEGTTVEGWGIWIFNIHDFVREYGFPVQLIAPNEDFNYWSIYVSDSFKFGQR